MTLKLASANPSYNKCLFFILPGQDLLNEQNYVIHSHTFILAPQLQSNYYFFREYLLSGKAQRAVSKWA